MNRSVLVLLLLALLVPPVASSQEQPLAADPCWKLFGVRYCPPWAVSPAPSCPDCEVQVHMFSPTLRSALVRLPVDFVTGVDALWLASDEGTRVQLWPHEYFAGDLRFRTEEGVTWLLFKGALRGRGLAELTLEAELDGRLYEVSGVEQKRVTMYTGYPGSSTCSSCSVVPIDGVTRIRLPLSLLRNALSLRLARRAVVASSEELTQGVEPEAEIWPPSAEAPWLSAVSEFDESGEAMVEFVVDDPHGGGRLVMTDLFGGERILLYEQ